MAAGIFFLASLEARSFIFPCCKQSLFDRFRFPFPFALRLSAANPKFSHPFVSKCSKSDLDSTSGHFDILSATEYSDGSVIFRFGNASETAIIKAEQSQAINESAKVVSKVVGKDLDKEDVGSIKAVNVYDGEREVEEEPVRKKVGGNLKVKSQPRRKPRRNATRVADIAKQKAASVISNGKEIKKFSVDSSKHMHPKGGPDKLDNAVKMEKNSAPKGNGRSISKTEGEGAINLNMLLKKDLVPHVEKSSPLAASVVESEITTQLASSESGSVVEVPHGVKFQEENDGASEGSGENIGKIEGTALNVVSKTDLVADIEKGSPLAASAVESAITAQSASSESGSIVEVPYGVKFPEENDGASEGSGENVGKIEGTAMNVLSKMDLVPDVEKFSPPLAAPAIETEITSELASLESGSRSEVPHGVKFQEENDGAFEGSGENVGKIEVTALNVVSKMDLAADIEKGSPPLAASAVESKITYELASLESGSKSEVPQGLKFQEENDGASDGGGENVGKIEGTALNVVSKMDLDLDIKKVSPPLAASAVESEITSELDSLESGSKSEVPHGLKFQEESDGASKGSGENVGKIERTALNVVSKMDLVPDIEKVSPPLAASAVESEIRTELASLEPGLKSEVSHSVKLQEENSSAGENGESVDKIEDASLDAESKMDLAVEEVCAQVAASENNIKREIKTQSSSLVACSNIEVPHSLEFQESGKDDPRKDVAQKSVSSKERSKEHIINASKMLVLIDDANEGDVGEVKLNSTLAEVKSILSEATVHKTVDESVDINVVNSSKMSEEGVPFSFSSEITKADAQSGNKVRVPMLTGDELQLGRKTLEREEISTAGFFLYSGAALLPNPTKAFAGGEDAYFIARQNWLGLADGVGNWSLEGISVGLYAKELMENCAKVVSDRNGVPITDPVKLLNRAAANTRSSGLSTVLVAYFDDQALRVANIGDSGFMIIRNGAVLKRSSPMVYEFNFPAQIERGDDPSDFVEVYRIDLKEGDVIISATNGLFDNLYEQDITSIVLKSLQESLRPQEIAELLATRAQEVAQLSSFRSPFADAAQAAGYVGYRGGKLDDVTVIVSLVKRRFSNHVQ